MSLPIPSTDDVFIHNVTTSETLPGYRITSSKGMVRGISVRARALGPMICAVFQILCCGGRIAVMEYMCEQARQDAAADMLAHARRLGCNAVVSVRYDGTSLGPVSENLCYGTAVVIEPEEASGGSK